MSSPTSFPPNLAERLGMLHEIAQDPALLELKQMYEERIAPSAVLGSRGRSKVVARPRLEKGELEAFRDRLSTRLMDAFRVTQDQLAFGLLYEVNYRLFLAVIAARLRKFYFALDAQDVLQEVFFNIYRYPHKFKADRDQAFRHWASMIIRNTVYKCTRDKDRETCHELQDEEIETRADVRARTPLGTAIREESAEICSRTYILYLRMYLAAYEQLSERERTALYMVEVAGEPYKAAAAALEIRLENLKMVIFRARKKILRTLDRVHTSVERWEPTEVGGTAIARDEDEVASDAASNPRASDRSIGVAEAPRRSAPRRSAPRCFAPRTTGRFRRVAGQVDGAGADSSLDAATEGAS